MSVRRVALITTVALTLACGGQSGEPEIEGSTGPVDTAGEEQALMNRSREWSAAVGRGDMEAALEFWADDAVLFPPDMPMLNGKEAIRAYVSEAGNIPGFSISWEPISAHVSGSGDMAYMIERNEITMNDSTGTPVTTHGKAVSVWRKQGDVWVNVIDIWNTDPTFSPPDRSAPVASARP